MRKVLHGPVNPQKAEYNETYVWKIWGSASGKKRWNYVSGDGWEVWYLLVQTTFVDKVRAMKLVIQGTIAGRNTSAPGAACENSYVAPNPATVFMRMVFSML